MAASWSLPSGLSTAWELYIKSSRPCPLSLANPSASLLDSHIMKASILSLGLLAGTALAFPQDMDSMTEALRENALAQLAQKDQAAFTFIYRFMSNKSAEYPSGVLNRNVIKSFMSIRQGSDGSLTWVPGNERIPDDWVRL